MDIPILFIKTLLLRPYVFIFLVAFLLIARQLLGWKRTGLFFVITWATAFICEFSSTHTGIPFGWYHYTGSTVGHELYVANVPFMDSLSFTFLLFASYCLSLSFLLPSRSSRSRRPTVPELMFDQTVRTSWPVLALTVLFFSFIDVIIDPVALRGERWFLGKIYYYPDPGIHFGVPIANYVGWAVVGFVALSGYLYCDRWLTRSVERLGSSPSATRNSSYSAAPVTVTVMLGSALYYGVLLFNLSVTFWIGEPLIGMTGILIYIPITILLTFRLLGLLPAVALPDQQKQVPPEPPH